MQPGVVFVGSTLHIDRQYLRVISTHSIFTQLEISEKWQHILKLYRKWFQLWFGLLYLYLNVQSMAITSSWYCIKLTSVLTTALWWIQHFMEILLHVDLKVHAGLKVRDLAYDQKVAGSIPRTGRISLGRSLPPLRCPWARPLTPTNPVELLSGQQIRLRTMWMCNCSVPEKES